MDLSDVVLAFASAVTLTRGAADTYGTDGRRIAANTAATTIQAVSLPLNGRDLARLPEGLRTRQLLKFVTTVPLFTQDATHLPDVITYGGETFQIQSVEPWDTLGNFWASIGAKTTR